MGLSNQGFTINSLLLGDAELAIFQDILLSQDSWDEYQLLKQSFARLQRELPDFNDSLSLFQGHFIVFNALYRLIASQQCPKQLALEVTRIQLLPVDASQAPLDHTLMNYYLDEENLINTSRSMIETMLDNWGVEFARYLNNEQVTQLYHQHRRKTIAGK